MSRPQRTKLIQQIEKARGTKVIAYVTSDRAPVPAQIGDDAVRPIYEHLRQLGRVPKLDVFIYSRGGAIDVPWRLVTALRQSSDEWNILIPFRANSAATLIALGADHIVLGRRGELGPIDPIMSIQRTIPQPGGGMAVLQENVSVEDVMAYTRFVRERAGLSDQAALATALSKLTEKMDAVSVGNLYRTHSHIRNVARLMLQSRKDPSNEQVIGTIVETLAEKVYAHGHAVGLRDAEQIGLPVEAADETLDDLLWSLLNEYETDLKLLEPIDPTVAVASADAYNEETVIAMVESAWAVDEFAGRIEIRARRQLPQNMNVALNLNLQLPSAIDANQLPQALQQALQQLLQQGQQLLLQQAQAAVQQAMKDQAPMIGVDAGFRGGSWKRTVAGAGT